MSYTYPGTDTLINIPGIRDPEELHRFERQVTAKRLMELKESPIKGNFDLDHLKAIHKYIFQDVYPFAGQIRTVNIAKGDFVFAPIQFLESNAKELFNQLRAENFLKNIDLNSFSQRAAHYMAEINVLHPFREGNGRTQREFIRQLANNAGYELNWSSRDKYEVLSASIQSRTDTRDLSEIIKSCIMNPQPRTYYKELDSPTWITTDLKLKDILKIAEGLPSLKNTMQLNSNTLNREVSMYQITKMGKQEILSFKFKNDDKVNMLQMEKHPYLSKEAKNLMIDRAASDKLQLNLQNFLER